MYLLELAAQNVRGMSPQVRSPLKPGYLAVKAPGPVSLGPLALSLLYPDGRGGDAAFAAPGQKAKASLSLIGNDQVAYRLIRELGGAGSLQRLNRQAQSFETVTEDSAEMAQYLRGQAGLPTRAAFEKLFTYAASQLPTRRPRGSAKKAGAAAGLASAAVIPDLAQADPRTRVAELQKELALTKEVEELQFQADGLAQQIFEAEQQVEGSEGLRHAYEEAMRDLANAPTPEKYGLPPDIIEKAEAFPKLAAKRDEALARLADEAANLPPDVEPQAVPPVWKDRNFLLALAGGVGVLAAGMFMSGAARYVALLDIPAFGFAAFLALRYVDDLESTTHVSRKGGMLAAREKKIRDDFDVETRYVRAAMKAVGVETPEELISALGQRELLQQRADEYAAQLRVIEADPANAAAARKVAQLKTKQEQLNQQLSEKGAYVRDPREVERELMKAQEQLAGQRAAPAAAPAAPALAPGEKLDDPCPELLALAADLLQSDVPTTAAAFKDRVAQYLSALTDRRYIAVDFDLQGKATLTRGTPGTAKVAAGDLEPRDLDILYLSLRLTAVERVCAKVKVPLILEDELPVDEAKVSLLARMLKHLGTVTQVLHVSAHPAFAQVSDAQVNL